MKNHNKKPIIFDINNVITLTLTNNNDVKVSKFFNLESPLHPVSLRMGAIATILFLSKKENSTDKDLVLTLPRPSPFSSFSCPHWSQQCLKQAAPGTLSMLRRTWPFVHNCASVKGKYKIGKRLRNALAILNITLKDRTSYGTQESKLLSDSVDEVRFIAM